MKTLAETLGVMDPRKPEAEQTLQPRTPHKLIADFAQDILASDEYRASLLRRIFLDELPPAIEALLYYYAHGKPVEKVEVRDVPIQIDELSAEQLEQRAMFLVECARKMRQNEQPPVLDDDAPAPPESKQVH